MIKKSGKHDDGKIPNFLKNQESSEAENCTKHSYCTEDLNLFIQGRGIWSKYEGSE